MLAKTRITSFNKRQIYPGDLINYSVGNYKADKCIFCMQQAINFTYLSLVNRSELKRLRLGRFPTHVYFHKVKCCHTCLPKLSRRYAEGLYIIHDALNYAITQQVNEFTAHLYSGGGLLDNYCAFCAINKGKTRSNIRIPVGVNRFFTNPLSVCDTCMNGISHIQQLLNMPKYSFLKKAFHSQSEIIYSTCKKCNENYPILDKELKLRLGTNTIDYACDKCAIEYYRKTNLRGNDALIIRFHETECTECNQSIVIDKSIYPFLNEDDLRNIKCTECKMKQASLPNPSSISLLVEIQGKPFYIVNVNERDDGSIDIHMYSVFNDNVLIATNTIQFIELYRYITFKTLNLTQCDLNDIEIQTLYPDEST